MVHPPDETEIINKQKHAHKQIGRGIFSSFLSLFQLKCEHEIRICFVYERQLIHKETNSIEVPEYI